MDLTSFCAVVVAGGQGIRLGGFDKGSVEIAGRTLLDRALDAVGDASEVVVVGEQVPTERPVTFVLEDPRHGGPVAALLTGVDALLRRSTSVVVIAVDMPMLTTATVRRLQEAAVGRDGAVLVGPDGRRQLAMSLDRDRLGAVRPDLEGQHGYPVHRLVADLDLAEVSADHGEHRDVDTWTDLGELRELAELAGSSDEFTDEGCEQPRD